MTKSNIAFLGRGETGLQVLNGLIANPKMKVIVIITCDHSIEVGQDEVAFLNVAKEHNIPFYKTNNINKPEWFDLLSSYKIDLGVAMLWLHTIGKEVIESSRMGFLNLHGGMLPRYRGNACQTWAILNNEKEIGLTVHLIEADRLDSGPIVLQKKIEILPDTTVGDLFKEVTEQGIELVLEAANKMISSEVIITQEQDESKSLRCYPRLPKDGEINWNNSSVDIYKLIRAAGSPYPGAYCYFENVRENNEICKLTIDKAHIEKHNGDYFAVNGHLLKLEGGNKCGIVCGDKNLIILDEIRINNIEKNPSKYFKTVRQRMGIDYSLSIDRLSNKVNNPFSPFVLYICVVIFCVFYYTNIAIII